MKKCPKCGNECRPSEKECSKCGSDLVLFFKKLARETQEATQDRIQRVRHTAKLNQLVAKMSPEQLAELIDHAENLLGIQQRMHDRIPCLLTADCIINNRAAQKYIKDISLSGAFVEPTDALPLGMEIPMTLSMSREYKPFKVVGEIARTNTRGIGIRFKTTSQVQEEMIREIVQKVEQFSRNP